MGRRGGRLLKLTPDQDHLTIETLVVNDSVAVGRGHLNPFYYYGELIDVDWGMEVTFWLYFDENFKIKKQIDWVEYALSVLDNIFKQYGEKGINELPDWLDLTKKKITPPFYLPLPAKSKRPLPKFPAAEVLPANLAPRPLCLHRPEEKCQSDWQRLALMQGPGEF